VDRVDSWLNAQRDWRRFGVEFLSVLMPTAAICAACDVWRRDSSYSGTHTTGQVAQALVVSVPVAAVLACLMLIVAVAGGRRGTQRLRRQARIAWRVSAGVALLSLNSISTALTSAESPSWRLGHRWIFLLQLIALAGAVALMMWGSRELARDRDELAGRGRGLAGAPGDGDV
jgi:hypothetical protein